MELMSFIPGRIRLQDSRIYRKNKLGHLVELYLRNLTGVKKSRVNSILGTILIIYDVKKVNIKTLINEIKKIDKQKSKYLKYIQDNYDDYFREEKKLKLAQEKTLFFGSIYIFYKLKEFIIGKSFFNRSLSALMMAANVTFIKDYPILNKLLYRKIGNYFSTTADKFLFTLAIILTLLRESKGVFLLFLKSVTDFMQAYSNLEIKKVLMDAKNYQKGLVWYAQKEQDYLLPITKLEIGDIISYYKNEMISINGIVTSGKAVVNCMYYSGEPELRTLEAGDKVYEGMFLVSGEIRLEVTSIPNCQTKTDLSFENLKLTQRVKTYQRNVFYFALIMAMTSYFITGMVFSSVSVLLVMAPAAVGVSLNIGLAKYVKLLLNHKIMLQNVNTIEKIINTNNIVFDKTGTLTTGNLEVANIKLFSSEYSEEKLLEICLSCKSLSQDPRDKLINLNQLTTAHDFNYQDKKVTIGTKEILKEKNIEDSLCEANDLENYYLSIYVIINSQVMGRVDLIEELTFKAKNTIFNLQQREIEDIYILSGDKEKNVRYIADKLSIKDYKSEFNAQEKKNWVARRKENKTLTMIGDGINDVEAMKEADLSISVNNHSCKQATLSSDCIFLENRMELIPILFDLTQQSYYQIERNIALCQSYNIVFGLVAMLGYINPFLAKGLNTINSLVAILNSAKILKITSSDNKVKRVEGGNCNEKVD